MNSLLNNYDKRIVEINIIISTLFLYLFRIAIPFLKYPFILMFLSLVVYSVFKYKQQLLSKVVSFIYYHYIMLILLVILIISYLLSHKLYLEIFKDILNAIILVSIFLIMTIFIKTKDDLITFSKNINYQIIIFALFISFYSLINTFNIISFDDKPFITQYNYRLIVESLQTDYNFAILPVLFGMISIFFIMINKDIFTHKLFYNLALLIFSLNIFFSGSRRGLISLIFILVTLGLAQFFFRGNKNLKLQRICKRSIYFIISLTVISFLFIIITFNASYAFKNKILDFIGTKNRSETRIKIALAIHRYSLIINKSISYSQIYKAIWTPVFDPKDPDSTWGVRIHRTVFPLMGDNVEIVPPDTKGYLMDSTCNANIWWSGNACSYTQMLHEHVNKNDIVNASVFCYVSKDFNGDWVSLYSDGTAIGGKCENNFNLENKGKWQKLNLNLNCSYGDIYVHLFFSKNGLIDFTSLRGFVIFAYPQIKIISTKNQTLSDTLSFYEKYTYNKLNFSPLNKIFKRYILGIRKDNFKSYEDHMSNEISVFNFSYAKVYKKDGVINLNNFINTNLTSINPDKDPIRRWISLFISEDTTYYSSNTQFLVDTISYNFFGDRLIRWQFSLQIFSNEFGWKEKLFGGGFNFLNWYGYYFDNDKKRSDYPHNPFLSILLYSGLFGLIVYLIFMYKVFYYYIRYFNEYKILTAFFIITFFFSFFSAGSPFDPPIMGFFVILPFFIHSVHENEKTQL